MKITRILLAALCLMPLLLTSTAFAADYIAYIGDYTRGATKGIYGYRFDPATGSMTLLGVMAETTDPSFLAIHPNRRFLYAVNENDKPGLEGNTVSAFSIDSKTGHLKFLNKVSTRGVGPCHVSVDKSGRNVLVANYQSGSLAIMPIHADGTLSDASAFVQYQGSSANPQRQKGPHTHCAITSPDNRFALVADLGLDRVMVYHFDAAKGTITPNEPPYAAVHPGEGPRHLAFHPNGKILYLITEMGSTVTTFAYQPSNGTLRELQDISALPAGFTGKSTGAEIQIDRSGRHLYASNRGSDTIAVFNIDPAKFTLTHVQDISTQGAIPRYIGLDPTGAYLFSVNQNGNNIVQFRVDAKTGRLTPTGQVLKDVGSPVCMVFLQPR
ncbi:MAG TPA: lactonase family protein [Bryobacteraceae bacterium]|nr:lactonase family protein [Bryobacteraceae bacterium]